MNFSKGWAGATFLLAVLAIASAYSFFTIGYYSGLPDPVRSLVDPNMAAWLWRDLSLKILVGGLFSRIVILAFVYSLVVFKPYLRMSGLYINRRFPGRERQLSIAHYSIGRAIRFIRAREFFLTSIVFLIAFSIAIFGTHSAIIYLSMLLFTLGAIWITVFIYSFRVSRIGFEWPRGGNFSIFWHLMSIVGKSLMGCRLIGGELR